jgi:hypothetical protein
VNTAEQLMVVKAYIWGLQQVEAQLKGQVLELKGEVGASQFRTPLGPVSVATPKPKVVITNDRKFLAWVLDNHPDQIEQTVRESYAKAFVLGLVIDGSEVFTRDGELVEFAGVEQRGEYVSATLSAPVKADAEVQVAGALDRLLGVLQIEAGR